MSSFTPGPWNFRTAANGDCGISADGTVVFVEAFAEIRHSGENAREEAKANARLIAAAPELLQALKYARRFLRGIDHDVDYVDGVIAKAEGRS